eukprot:s1748_g2.t1
MDAFYDFNFAPRDVTQAATGRFLRPDDSLADRELGFAGSGVYFVAGQPWNASTDNPQTITGQEATVRAMSPALKRSKEEETKPKEKSSRTFGKVDKAVVVLYYPAPKVDAQARRALLRTKATGYKEDMPRLPQVVCASDERTTARPGKEHQAEHQAEAVQGRWPMHQAVANHRKIASSCTATTLMFRKFVFLRHFCGKVGGLSAVVVEEFTTWWIVTRAVEDTTTPNPPRSPRCTAAEQSTGAAKEEGEPEEWTGAAREQRGPEPQDFHQNQSQAPSASKVPRGSREEQGKATANLGLTGARTKSDEGTALIYLGGMSDPHKSVIKLPMLQTQGLKMWERWGKFATTHREALEVAESDVADQPAESRSLCDL